MDPLTLEGMQKKIMLERFQSEVVYVCPCACFSSVGSYVLRIRSRQQSAYAEPTRGIGPREAEIKPLDQSALRSGYDRTCSLVFSFATRLLF